MNDYYNFTLSTYIKMLMYNMNYLILLNYINLTNQPSIKIHLMLVVNYISDN